MNLHMYIGSPLYLVIHGAFYVYEIKSISIVLHGSSIFHPVYFTQYISPSIFHPVKMCMSGLTRMVFLSEIFCTFVYCSESGSDSDVTDQCT